VRAMVYTRPNVVEMLDVGFPAADDGEALVTVANVGICGSELHGIASTEFRKPPLIMGHEFAGTTADGRRVVVNPLLSCGHCDHCLAGRDHLCRTRRIIGIHRPGAFAEVVPVPDAAIHEIPAAMSFETAAMVEPLANAVHALALAQAEPDARIAVIGAGPIGLVCTLVALEHSADVTVCDLSEERLAAALALGAQAVSPRLTGEFDLVVDAVGAAATHRDSVERLRRGGTAVWVGLMSAEAGFDAQEVVREEKQVIGSYCYTAPDFAAALELVGKVPTDWVKSFPLEQGVEVFNELMAGRTDIVKAQLVP
jgi:threonine dehydrogenase-like Zn-dependent dehydrogenase